MRNILILLGITQLLFAQNMSDHKTMALENISILKDTFLDDKEKNPIPSAKINVRPYDNVYNSMLNGLSGLSATSTGVGIIKPVIRGLSNSRIILLNNGMRLEQQQWGDEHGISLDESMVETGAFTQRSL